MDDRTFDRLAMALASRRSRRAFGAAAALGVLVGGRRAAASHGSLNPGDACYSSQQCRPNALYCADNGYGDDGQTNCCNPVGSYCTNDRGCCGQHVCSANACAAPGGPAQGQPGAVCASNQDCSQSLGPFFCGDNGYNDDGPTNCCFGTGGPCATNRVCCGSLTCQYGAGGNGSCG